MFYHSFFQFVSKRFHNLAILSVCCIIIGAFGEWHWFAELFSHFLPHYTLIFILAMLFVSGAARAVWATCAFLSVVWLINPQWQTDPDDDAKWTLMWYNVNINNPNIEKEIDFINEVQPDFIAAAEMNLDNPKWEKLLQTYPYGCANREDSPFALVLLSKRALQHCNVHFVHDIPYIRAITQDHAAIYALHPPPPINENLAKIRQDYLQTTAKQIANDPNVLIVGDFNSSPFSPIFQTFMKDTSTNLATANYFPTWQPFGLNIDHVLSYSSTLHEVSTQALPWQHSDHRPILVYWH